MPDSDSQQLSQMAEYYNIIADNQQPDAARDLRNAMQNIIENNSLQSRTSENEKTDDDSKKS